MYGKVIGTSICVDCLDEVLTNGIYFLTEACVQLPLPLHIDLIYTSPHNAWLLQTIYKLDSEMIVSLPLNKKLLLQDKVKNLDFNVTLMDAKQKPGVVMFLFEGKDIGNVLYAGKCCYSEDFISKPLRTFLKSQMMDCLYVHDACEECHLHSVTVSAAVEEVVNCIRQNFNHNFCIIDQYFREDILNHLNNKIQKPICVSQNWMKHLEYVGRGTDFTLDRRNSQIYITEKPLERVFSSNQPQIKIILLPCLMKKSSQEIKLKISKISKKGYRAIMYRNHCSASELIKLAEDINAKRTILFRHTSNGKDPAEQRKKNLDYWAHIKHFPEIIELFDNLQTRAALVEEKSCEVIDLEPESCQDEGPICVLE